ncbi:MAG TPA: hypothetical protein DEF00_01540 [Candidatus Taylorbacteria bacterium]|nr:MAG: hypothetical protein UY03_C0002G0042 [Parcubacteria group bacterium GW2011_GWA2_47_64]KKU96758.1 MAG: hypothetical protein UY29_C0007G0044 [Parcubacteria group bacterium GW2011_GWC2_48_17]HBV01060.1 hypothetical protein [Candidatus Taylorbacteria bacterium]
MTTKLATAVILLFSTFYGAPSGELAANGLSATDTGFQQVAVTERPLTLEQYVREYFRDTPIMAEIARCESSFRHLGKSGKVLRGKVTAEDLGVMQINEFYHEDNAKALGFDLHTLDGNLAYARWLYAKEGLAPWLSSSKCWQKSDTLARAYNIKVTTN